VVPTPPCVDCDGAGDDTDWLGCVVAPHAATTAATTTAVSRRDPVISDSLGDDHPAGLDGVRGQLRPSLEILVRKLLRGCLVVVTRRKRVVIGPTRERRALAAVETVNLVATSCQCGLAFAGASVPARDGAPEALSLGPSAHEVPAADDEDHDEH